MTRWLTTLVLVLGLLCCVGTAAAQTSDERRIGSKKFTESVILGELGCQLLVQASVPCEHRRELGGTRVLCEALKRGDIDVYPEYTGTLIVELLGLGKAANVSFDELKSKLAAVNVHATLPFGFNNTYALAMKKARAAELGITKISDLKAHPTLSLRFGNEFMDRADGWPALSKAYGLHNDDVRALDHDLAYRGLAAGDVDVMDAYTTDADIDYYGLTTLADDKQHFPRYEALFIYRAELSKEAVVALERMQGRIDDDAMLQMNVRAKIQRVPEAKVAAEFANTALALQGDKRIAVEESSRLKRLLGHTLDHLFLVGVSLFGAILPPCRWGLSQRGVGARVNSSWPSSASCRRFRRSRCWCS